MLEHERNNVAVVHLQCHCMGEHLSKNVDPPSTSLSSEGQSNAEGSEALDRPMASGVLGRDPGQSLRCILETPSIG